MWVLALGGVFLATAQGCVLCHLPARDLSGRLAQLCSRVEVLWKNCGASWSFPAFALDEASMNKVTEKTHRVLRVMEIKGSPSSLRLYWHWLQHTKLPAYTREALCAPACPVVPLSPAGGSTILYNCSTCQEFKVRCWPRKRCLPGSHDLREARILLLSVLVAALLLGVMSLVVESRYHLEAKRTSEDTDSLLAAGSQDHEPITSTSPGGDQPAP
ncbi:sperm-egg fusion protein TMEM95 isoform X1 [Ursus americanus]|uniref:sperm-egg fusion protein TMEM95 isoform X1 n=1 Tax=Ursus americanus TaxID=9643 RepID=UPI001E67BC4C|nr:sperm-egg fusion protein TMEM95 isoform X1 [Ursus americanus]